MTAQSQPPKSIGDSERWDHYDALLIKAHGDMFARKVVLVEKLTGATLATYPSLEAAFAALPEVPDGIKSRAYLGWA